ncbi:MAG: cytochrome P460 family protein [bacterium]|nr:cytochrome P460 family protein [bacterium]
MTASKNIFVFACVFAFTLALFALSALAQPSKTPLANAERMNGYALGDYEAFWKRPDWHFVTVRYRRDSNEMRLTYANDIAWKALLAGGKEYPEGAVFGKVGLLTQDDPSFTSSAVPAGARRYQLMIRDKEKGKGTNGWAYALFDGRGKAAAEDQDIASQACWACHALVPERGEVFSQPIHMDISDTLPDPAVTPFAQAIPRVEFTTVKAETLPEKIRAKLPPKTETVRLVQGKLALNLFRGTIDEIRPTLARESLRAKMPAILMSVDGTLFSVVQVDDGKSCELTGGGKGVNVTAFYTTGTVPGKDSLIADHQYCEKK